MGLEPTCHQLPFLHFIRVGGYRGKKNPQPRAEGLFFFKLLLRVHHGRELRLVEFFKFVSMTMLKDERGATTGLGALPILFLLDFSTTCLFVCGKWLAPSIAFSAGNNLLILTHVCNSVF